MKRILFMITVLIYSSLCQAYDITPRMDRSEIHQGESFQITFTVKGKNANVEPDFSPLAKDFTILGSSTSTQMTVINSRSSLITDYTITLLPKQRGHVTIPSLQFASQTTKPVKLTILGPKKITNRMQGDRAFIDASVDTKSPFVQSQLTYTLRLYYSTNINSYHLTDPHLDDAVVFRLGKDRQYQTTLKDKSFQVLERQYAIFPQQSGQVQIQSPVLTGFQIDSRIDYRGFFNLNQANGKPIKLVAPNIKLNVKPIPSQVKDSWLPAKKLMLKQSWTHSTDDFKVGDPITRTMTITATGLTGAQLPELPIEKNDKLHAYRDKATLDNGLDGDSVVAKRIEKIAYIPLKAGKLTIPAVNIHWWNTASDRAEVAIIPGKTFNVQPSLISQPAVTQHIKPKLIPKPSPASAGPVAQSSSPSWLIIVAIALAVGWLLTLIAWFIFSKRKTSSKPIVVSEPPINQRHLKQRLKQACDINDRSRVKQIILQWAHVTWPDDKPHNLRNLAIKLGDSSLAAACIELDKNMYAAAHTQWNGPSFWQAFLEYKPPATSRSQQPIIPPLYPEH